MSRKLICKITGKLLFAGKDYYNKKVEAVGCEEKLHKTYICKEAKSLVKKGYTIDDIRSTIKVYDDYECTITDEEARNIVGSGNTLRINTNVEPTVGVIKTDPAVKKFLKKILK